MSVRQGVRNPYLMANSAFYGSPSHSDISGLIDNSRNPYIRIRLHCGVVVMCRPQVFLFCPKVLSIIYHDMCRIIALMPPSLHPLIRRTKIWVNHQYAYGLKRKPIAVKHTTAHHHHDWLLMSRDRPEKAIGIEVYNAEDFCRMRQHWNGCGLLLHEMMHVVHQVVLGLQNQRVVDLFRDAKRSKRYDRVLRRDWAGKSVQHDLHYCMVDHKEFFAEMAVTFWSRGYRDLDQADTSRMDLCSPPITSPIVRKRLENVKTRLLEPMTTDEGHCNKFQPFTAGQFREFDPELYGRMASLWEAIADWKDTEQESVSCAQSCWTPWPTPTKTPLLLSMSDTVSL